MRTHAKKNEKTTTDNAMAEAFEEYDADLAALEDGACSVGLFVRARARAMRGRVRAAAAYACARC